MRRSRTILIIAAISVALLFATPFAVQAATNNLSAAACQKAGGTGLTAFMVLKSGSTVHGQSINAKGCDIGIYIPPGSSNVKITGTTITGANDHGIFAQDSWNILIENNLLWGNGINGGHSCNVVSKGPCVAEDKALQFAGVSNSKIYGNTVRDSGADGGIGITDDGPAIDSGALSPSATKIFWSNNDVVSSNTLYNNLLGCGFVLSTYNPGGGAANTWVTDNTVLGVSPSAFTGQEYIGQIVIATDGPYGTISGTHVLRNHIDGSLLPGIVVHSNTFGDKISNIWIENNVVSENGWYPPPFATGSNDPQAKQGAVGVALISEHNVQPKGKSNPVLENAYVTNNTYLNDNIAVWQCFVVNGQVSGVNGNSNVTVVHCPGG